MKPAHEKIKFMLGRKVGMTQILVDQKIVPVTVVEAGPLTVTQVKTVERMVIKGSNLVLAVKNISINLN